MTTPSLRFARPALLAAALACYTALPALAQSSAAEQAYNSADNIVHMANSVVLALDQDKALDVFKATPVFVRQQVTQADFINGLTSERARLPAQVQRQWVSVERVALTLHGTQQVVSCANVVYQLTGLPVQARERVSLCWQDNSYWLPTGYSVLVQQAPAPAGRPAAPAPAPAPQR